MAHSQRYVQVLIPGTCECYLIRKRGLADVIKLRISSEEIIQDYLRGPLNDITSVLPNKKEAERDLTDKGGGNVTTEAECGVMGCDRMLAATRSWKR